MTRALLMALVILTACSGDPCVEGASRCQGTQLWSCVRDQAGDAAWTLTEECVICRDCADLGDGYAGGAACTTASEGILCRRAP
mgnify:CR=1 FL=1|jgi:hypothetical protein